QELSVGITTVKYSVHRLVMRMAGRLHFDPAKLRARILEVVRASCRVVGVAAFREMRRRMQARATMLGLDLFVSGKTYLLPIIHQRLQRCGYTGGVDQLKVHLAREW